MTVAAALEVGRTGMIRLMSVEVDVAMEDNGGHETEPHARSVGQQPPPRLGSQDRKPEEQRRLVEVIGEE